MPAHDQHQRVYYADTDATGVMFHAAYLVFAERARTDALRAAGAPAADLATEHGLHFLVHRLEAEYRHPLRLDDLVKLRTGTTKLLSASCQIRQEFHHEDRLTTRVAVDLVCVRAGDGRPARIPPRWRDALAALAFHPTAAREE